jgi:outer membrane immunogenic protein
MKKLFIGAALAALVGNPVLAADMLVKAPAAPTYSWGGFYVGGNVGWLGIEGVSLSGTPADNATAALFGPCSAAGACPTSIGSTQGGSVSGGGQFGFNWQVQSWVIGLEADAQAAGANASSSANVNVPPFGPYFASQNIKETGFGTIRGRAGLSVTPNVLAYVTGGFAWAATSQSFAAGFPLLSETANGGRGSTAVGGTVGAGLEWALGDRWSVAGEYLYAPAGGHQSHPPDRSSRGWLYSGWRCVVSAQRFRIELHQQHRTSEDKLQNRLNPGRAERTWSLASLQSLA